MDTGSKRILWEIKGMGRIKNCNKQWILGAKIA